MGPFHQIPATGGAGAALAEGLVFEKYADTISTSDEAGMFDLSAGGGGTYADPGGWYDADEEVVVLPAGTYQLDVGAEFGGLLVDAWRLVCNIAGETIDKKITVPAVLQFETFHCRASAMIHFPEPVSLAIIWEREGTTLALISVFLRIAALD